jgi:FtsP/CotA-like multicopper oxidase with cupredoxin domain
MNFPVDSMESLTRRRFLFLAGGASSSPAFGFAQDPAVPAQSPADITLRIGELSLELAPRRTVKTIGYNGQVPGPLLRVPEGKPINVDVYNETGDAEVVHWHGLHIPSDVDGSHEEGTPYILARGHRRYVFTPTPAGTRWYHTHVGSGHNLNKATYTGQFGMLIVEPRSDPGRYDLEIPLLLHEWEPYWDDNGPRTVGYRLYSINGKMLGAGEPVRVRPGQRVLFRIVNASATLAHRLALPGHTFRVMALDGNPVPAPRSIPILELAPAERIDAVVEMSHSGCWILGSTDDQRRSAGMGIVIEYAGVAGPPLWAAASRTVWDYTIFGGEHSPMPPDDLVRLVFKEVSGHRWTINGKSFPKADPIMVYANRRYRWVLDNQSADPHPVHLHRHAFELVRVAGNPASGLMKDVVMVPAWKEVEFDVTTDHPGATLFHCHQQFHMDFGFMAMMLYRNG